MADATNFAEPALKARNCLLAAYAAAESRNYVEAWSLATQAEAHAAEFRAAMQVLAGKATA